MYNFHQSEASISVDWLKYWFCHMCGRLWRSTVAEGAESQDTSASASKVDVMMNTVERYVRQFGRISRKQLDPIVSSLGKEGM